MLEYRDTLSGISPNMLQDYFEGWWSSLTPAEHLETLRNSSHVVLAVDTDINRVVGFVNALTDGRQAAFIPMLEVIPDYRQRGIGSELMRRMLTKLDDVYGVDLMCDANMQAFYQKLGMQPTVGMALRRY